MKDKNLSKKNKENKESDIKDIKIKDFLKYYGIYFLIIFLITLPLKNIYLSIKLAFIYNTLFLMPFILLIENKNFIEKFFLNNLIGLTYAGIYVFLDVILKIKLEKITFIIISAIIFITSIIYRKK